MAINLLPPGGLARGRWAAEAGITKRVGMATQDPLGNCLLPGALLGALLLLGACKATEVPPQGTRVSTPTAPSTATPTTRPSQTPSATAPPSITPTASLRPDLAPTLPHADVQLIYSGDRERPYVALTFDLCQKPELPAGFDAAIVDVLEDADVPATFFLGGDWMRTHPEETLLLAKNPQFELGNHSWSHPDMRELDEAHIRREIVTTQDILYRLTGRQARLFRLPSGLSNDLVLSVIAWNGLTTIQWDADTADPVFDNDAENINRLVRERVENGSIVLMHANGRGWHTAEALPEMIKYLRSSGYTLVTVSQLIGTDPLAGGEH
jgi:peptidoglycan/xylan/chitin deacetylase (PgdA/CDA1 family)